MGRKKQYFTVSIVVPFHDANRNLLGNCVKSLSSQDYPKAQFEVILVDNTSNDTHPGELAEYPVKMVKEPRKGSYVARNRGISVAKGDIIAFTDSDCIAHKRWIRNLVRNYDDEGVVVVGGEILPYDPRGFVEVYSDRACILRQIIAFRAGYFSTANASFRREALMKIRGFDEMTPNGGDVDLCWRMEEAGYKIVFDPEAAVFHRQRTTVRDFAKQFFRYGYGWAYIVKRQPRRFRRLFKDLVIYRMLMHTFAKAQRDSFKKDNLTQILFTSILQIIRSVSFFTGFTYFILSSSSYHSRYLD